MPGEDSRIWLEGIERADYPRAALPAETDVLVIGGGITGVTAAYLAAKEGRKVVLLEKRKLGESVTCRTTGFLTQVIDPSPAKLIRIFGQEKARLILASHAEAIDGVEAIIKAENIECEFIRCSSYIYANNRREERSLAKMAAAYKELGVKAEYKTDKAVRFAQFGYIEVPNQAKFHALKYLTALARLAQSHGAVFAEASEVVGVDDQKDQVIVQVKDGGSIKAKEVFSATYAPLGQPSELMHRCAMYRSYVVEYKLPVGVLGQATYQDNLLPYHYFRVDRQLDHDRLIIGGDDHLEVLNLDHEINSRRVRDYAEKLFANYKLEEVRHWSGMVLNSVDSLAFIGDGGGNVFEAYAFAGTGMTYSYIAAKLFADKLTGRDNPYARIYDSKRKISWRSYIFG